MILWKGSMKAQYGAYIILHPLGQKNAPVGKKSRTDRGRGLRRWGADKPIVPRNGVTAPVFQGRSPVRSSLEKRVLLGLWRALVEAHVLYTAVERLPAADLALNPQGVQ